MAWLDERLSLSLICWAVVPPGWAVRVFHLGPGWSGSRVVVGPVGAVVVVVVVVVVGGCAGGRVVGRSVGAVGSVGWVGSIGGLAGAAGVTVMWMVPL